MPASHPAPHTPTPPSPTPPLRALLLGARGAVGSVIHRELTQAGHLVTAASRTAPGSAGVDLRGDLGTLTPLAHAHDVVINASGIERADLGTVLGSTPLVDISASSAYLDALRAAATGPVVLGAGLAPGLSTILVAELAPEPHDEVDVLVMLGAGEQHGPAALAWTAGLVGTPIYRAPEGGTVMNLRESRSSPGPDGRLRRYLRADFPDHILRADPSGSDLPTIRSYLTLSAAPMTSALALVGRIPSLRWALTRAPHLGNDAWHVIAHNRRTGARHQLAGRGQSEATGRLTARAAVQAARRAAETPFGAVTMADLVTLAQARSALS